MKNMTTLKHIAGLYLDIYSTPRDLTRPLTPEQVREAGAFFLDLLATHEAEHLIELERQQKSASQAAQHPDHSFEDIACEFVDKYKRENDIDEPLDGDETELLSHIFLEIIDDYQGNA